MKVTVLAGGVGAARFLEGLAQVMPPEDITIISNTGDDEDFFGLRVSPDVDIVIYTLAGAVDEQQGWGLAGETYETLGALQRFGYETWFNLGDQDLATHTHRTMLMHEGHTLSSATDSIARAFGLRERVLPMSDARVRTIVRTDAGELPFQEYFVKRRTEDEVRGVRFDGIDEAWPADGVIESIQLADAVIVAPSNPVVSIGPILAVRGVRDALRFTRARVAGVSPIIGGRTIKGPADRMMASLGMTPTAAGIAEAYTDFLEVLIIDEEDRELAPEVERHGVRAAVAQTVMRTAEDKRALAERVLREVQ